MSKPNLQQRRKNLIDSGQARMVAALGENGQVLGNGGILMSDTVPNFEDISIAVMRTLNSGYRKSGAVPIRLESGKFNVAVNLCEFIKAGKTELPEGRYLISYYSSSSQYRRQTIAVARNSIKGNIVLDGTFAADAKAQNIARKAAELPEIIATSEELAVACRNAIRGACGFKYIGTASKLDKRIPENDLRNYSFKFELNGKRAYMRADYVFAMAKHDWSDGLDAYGSHPVGVIITGNRRKQFKLFYGNEQGKNDISNIDHVIPQSKGGKTRVANLQMMSASENAAKGNFDIGCNVNSTKNAIASAKTMLAFARGITKGKNKLTSKAYRNALSIMRRDLAYSACCVVGLINI